MGQEEVTSSKSMNLQYNTTMMNFRRYWTLRKVIILGIVTCFMVVVLNHTTDIFDNNNDVAVGISPSTTLGNIKKTKYIQKNYNDVSMKMLKGASKYQHGEEEKLCRSLYRTKGFTKEYEKMDRQHSPLLFERDNVMVCRTPKVGTAELRCIQRSYMLQKEFKMLKNAQCRPMFSSKLGPGESKTIVKKKKGEDDDDNSEEEEEKGNEKEKKEAEEEEKKLKLKRVELHDVLDPTEFQNYLYSDDVRRVMFVRHPVRRILSGFLQIAKTKDEFWSYYGQKESLGFGPDAFRTWILNSSWTFEYDPICSKSSTYFSLEPWLQHWTPPQHCRCGLWDCNVQWNIYKIEEHSINEIMNEYIPGPWIMPPEKAANKTKNYHSKKYDEKKYLTPEVLEFLNDITKNEREFFNYEPLSFD